MKAIKVTYPGGATKILTEETIKKREGGIGGKFDPRSPLYWPKRAITDGVKIEEIEVEEKKFKNAMGGYSHYFEEVE